MIEEKGQFGNRVLLVESHDELKKILHEHGNNVLYVGVTTRDFTEYFRITLKERFKEGG